MNKSILTALLVAFSVVAVQAQKKASAGKEKPKVIESRTETSRFKTYTDAKKGVSIKYPETWTSKANSQVDFFFMRPYDEQGQKYKESVNLVTGSAEDLYLVEYVVDAQKKMQEGMQGFRVIRGEFIKINGEECYRMVYAFHSNPLDLQDVLYLFVKKGKAYSLTFGAIPETFDRFFPLFEKMAKSFHIK